VVDAYARLLTKGVPGEAYNVAGGQGIGLRDLFDRVAAQLDVRVIPESDPELMRPADIPNLVGDGAKLRAATGWTPTHTLDDTLRDTVDAQAH
jgi:GDP-4-dehydro-6-deoxy-D-mannose reductase